MYHLIGTVLPLGYLALFLFLIPRMKFFRIGNIPIRWFQGVFVLKVLSGFLLYLIYTYYYTDRSTADIWKYYDDGMVMFSALRESPVDYFKMLFGVLNDTPHFEEYYDRMNHWYRPYGSSIANDTHTIIRFNAFVRLFSLGHYNVHSVIVNFLGLIGLTGMLHFLKQMAPNKENWFFAAVFLMPGMMFWASGVLKEPLLLFGLGLFLYGFMSLVNDGLSIKRTVLILFSMFFLLTVKSYAFIALMPGLLAWQIWRLIKVHPLWIFLPSYALLAAMMLVVGHYFPNHDPLERLVQKQHEFYQLAEGGTYAKTSIGDTIYIYPKYYENLQFGADKKTVTVLQRSGAIDWRKAKTLHKELMLLPEGEQLEVLLDYGKTGSTIEIPRLDTNPMSIIEATPIALTNALFRPFPWEIRSPFMALSGLENLLIALLVFVIIVNFQGNVLSHPIFYLALSFALVILVLTGLTTPVIGAIVRYKVPALPFLVCGLMALINTDRIESKISEWRT
jgi:hypothetical protein